MNNYLAVDLGASSYRMMIGNKNGYKELARYNDHLILSDDIKYWDITRIYNNIVDCLLYLNDESITIKSLSINSWGCDVAPIFSTYEFKENGKLKTQIYAQSYLNGPTTEQRNLLENKFSKEELYDLTAIKLQEFNSIYRLIDCESKVQFIAPYIAYLLTGENKATSSIISTSQLLSKTQDEYNISILQKLNIRKELLPAISSEFSYVAPIMHKQVSHINVVWGPGHDTSYAFYNYDNHTAIINVGSWIICGINVEEPKEFNTKLNYERGLSCKYKALNNLKGMNGFNILMKEHELNLTFEQITKQLFDIKTNEVVDINKLDLNAPLYLQLNHHNCWQKQMAIYLNSIAAETVNNIKILNEVANNQITNITIIGGGSKNKYFIHCLKQKLDNNIEINFGSEEATVVGNIKFQMEVASESNK